MKSFNLLILIVSIVFNSCGTPSKQTSPKVKKDANSVDNAPKYAESITEAELKTMLYTYASDEFEGRETGKKGQKMAVDYLKSQYLEMGITSAYNSPNYFQKVPLEKERVSNASIAVNGQAFTNFEDHIVLAASESLNISIKDVVYIGYGIDTENYSDYKIDVTNKIVIAKSGEPKDANGNYVTTGSTEASKWTSGRQGLSSKREAAKAKGAKILIYLDEDLFARYAPYYKSIADSEDAARLSLKSDEKKMAMLMIGSKLGKALHPSILEDSTPKILSATLDVTIENKTETVVSENVAAFIKGTEKPDEILVISAHLDHEGIKDGKVYNGADDDGSGTIAILEIAEAFKMAEKNGHGPKRSILFLHVTGEEKGLLGSKYYTDMDPIFPLANTVANLNIDMIGRTDPKRKEGERNYIYLIGSDKLSTDLHNISEAVNKKYCNVKLDYTYNDENDPNRFYYRSDHYNFAKNNIPIIFYFNGTHDDYHQPTDTPDKIEYDLLENRTRLVFYTAWEVANRAERVIVDKAK